MRCSDHLSCISQSEIHNNIIRWLLKVEKLHELTIDPAPRPYGTVCHLDAGKVEAERDHVAGREALRPSPARPLRQYKPQNMQNIKKRRLMRTCGPTMALPNSLLSI